MHKEIYLLSGLGADERIFQNLDFKGYIPRHILWIPPHPKESLKDYTGRLRMQISAERPLILGVSFGGMIATEIARQITCEGIILVSTAMMKSEIPLLYRWAGKLKLHHGIPAKLLKQANAFTYWLFGMKSTLEKQLLKAILADTDTYFLSWALDAILRWDNKAPVSCKLRIHGGRDKILPVQNIKEPVVEVPNGGHLMIYSCADSLNVILGAILNGDVRE
ncbi:MAG: alpha/beta hydrolase [Saprospiraceae bacterium]|nr:alpha/beta hydrolase [Saprospiraceae bacterium]